jgi:hypothetical protein
MSNHRAWERALTAEPPGPGIWAGGVTSVNDYVIIKELGKGAFAEVKLCKKATGALTPDEKEATRRGSIREDDEELYVRALTWPILHHLGARLTGGGLDDDRPSRSSPSRCWCGGGALCGRARAAWR